jgi:aerobic carbon-monoxide dehydrogenase large subunit
MASNNNPDSNAGIGAPVLRKEDPKLLTGRGIYSDDVNVAGQLYAVVLRSPHPHARILKIDAGAALAMPGVHTVLTAIDAAADGLSPIHHPPPRSGPPDIQLTHRSGKAPIIPPQAMLAADKARFVGEAVALVVADTKELARDAAERIDVQYDPLPAVADAIDAAQPDAPKLWDDQESNLMVDADAGDEAAAKAAFAKAAHVVKLSTKIQRVTGVPMEPRAAVGVYDKDTGMHTLHAGGGGVVRPRKETAAILGIPIENMRVIAREVGGNFGTRNALYPEFPLVVWAAKRLGRPVKWTADRSESFLSDYQGRDLTVINCQLALDKEGRFLAIRGTNRLNVGAYPVTFVPLIKGVELMTGVYDIPAAYFRAQAVMSNKPPVNNYRSSGRPEAMFILERLIDMACAEHGFDRVEIRRKNFIPRIGEGYTNALGLPYDCGAYDKVMTSALAMGDWAGFEARRKEAAARGKLRGIGVSNYLELTGGYPRERTEITVHPEGRVDCIIGTLSSGQGHETSFAQLLVSWLGVPHDSVNLITGDTKVVLEGGGSQSARSMRMAGIVMGQASETIMARAVEIAAHVLGAPVEEIDFRDGRFQHDATNRTLDIFEIATAARDDDSLPGDLKGPLATICDETIPVGAFPYGCHVCEVEVDPETGETQIIDYAAVDDVGRAINPLILRGQTHGGAVQGIGQAMWEHCVYDPASAQLLSGSFLDYPMPRAHRTPKFKVEISEVPSPRNKLGIRGGGEGGTTPALAVVINAITDALSPLGVRHVEMPATPLRVWQVIQDAKAKSA